LPDTKNREITRCDFPVKDYFKRNTNPVARELAPARLRSSRKAGNRDLPETPH
jgi:hypothetical protein